MNGKGIGVRELGAIESMWETDFSPVPGPNRETTRALAPMRLRYLAHQSIRCNRGQEGFREQRSSNG
jgi:hypothetical protein